MIFSFVIFCQVLLVTSGMLPGGKQPISEEALMKHKYRFLEEGVEKGVEVFNRMSNSLYRYGFDDHDIVSATRQGVEGVVYEVVVKLKPLLCRNNEDSSGLTAKQCGFQHNSHPIQKTFKIWVRAWLSDPDKMIVTIE